MATTRKPTAAQRLDAMEGNLSAISEGLAALLEANASGGAVPNVTERKDASASTAKKTQRVKIPTHTNREIGYRVEPDSKYKRYTLFTYLKDDGTDFKSVRVRTDILRDAIANGDAVIAHEPPQAA